MADDAVLRRIADAARRYKRAQQTLEAARDDAVEAILEALRSGQRPTDVDRVSPFTSKYNRMLAREAGIEPAKRGRQL